MSWRFVPLANARPQPWKNGGGTTRELLALPEGSDWQLRISVAQVERAGPFSSFPGVARWFAVLAGAGVRLRVGTEDHVLNTRSQPLEFNGAALTHCTLVDGATQDFNLMVRDARQSRMVRVVDGMQERCEAGSVVAAYSATPVTVSFGAEQIELPADTLAWCTPESRTAVAFEGQGGLWMEVAP